MAAVVVLAVQVQMECRVGKAKKFYDYGVGPSANGEWIFRKAYGRIGTSGRREDDLLADLYFVAKALVASVKIRYEHSYTMTGHSPGSSVEVARVAKALDLVGRGGGTVHDVHQALEAALLPQRVSVITTSFDDYLKRLEGVK